MGRLRLELRGSGGKVLVIAGIALLGGLTLLMGGAAPSTATLFTALFSIWAAAVFAIAPPPAAAFLRPSLVVAGVACALLTLWIGLSLTPLLSFWVAPEWTRVEAAGAITVDRPATTLELLKLCGLACLFAGGLAIGADRTTARFFLRTLAVAAAVYAMASIASFIVHPGVTLLGEGKAFHADRLTGSFASANTAASLFGGLAVLFMVLAVEEGIQQLKATPQFGESRISGPTPALMLFAWTTLVCLSALWLTGSRFAMVATAAGLCGGLILMGVAAGLRAWMAALIGAGTLAVAIALPVFFSARAAQRAWNLGETVQDRLSATAALADLAATRPWQGFGLGAFREAITPAMTRDNLYLLWNLGAAHNLAVQWWLEAGIIGASLAGLAVLSLLVSIQPFPIRRHRHGQGRVVAVLGFAVVILAHNAVDYSLQIFAVAAIFAVLLGLAAGSAFQGQHKSETA